MSEFINTIDTLGDEAVTDSLIARTITEFADNNLVEITLHAFRGCNQLASVNLPSVTKVQSNAFQDCAALAEAELPIATYMAGQVFKNCPALAHVNAPKVTQIGLEAFYGCVSLESIELPALTIANNYIFSGCTGLKQASFAALTDVSESMFLNCSGLVDINLPAATSFSGNAFRGCTGLTKIVLPAAQSILNSAFYEATNLALVDIGAAVTLNYYAFGYCTSLETVILRNTESLSTLADKYAFYNTPIADGTGYIYVPAALVDSYKAASNWSNYADQIRAIEDYPEVCDPYNWTSVFKTINEGTYAEYYSVGDTIPLDLGDEGIINMQIAAFDADDLADGSGKAHITWIAKEVLTTKHRMNPALVTNSDSTYKDCTGAIGGWDTCEMRSYLRNTIKPLIPDAVRNAIKEVTKTQPSFTTSGVESTQTSTDDVWIPSYAELFGASSAYYWLFKDMNANRIKYDVSGASTKYWWLRSAAKVNDFHVVGKDGGRITEHSNIEVNAALCFCT